MNKKMLLGFLAGAVFILGLLVTCNTGSKGGGTRTASAGGDTVWEYATLLSTSSPSIEVPATATEPDISSCKTRICELNAMGADGWELVAIDGAVFYFKRLK